GHLPHGRPHHLRRPDALPQPGRGGLVAPARPDRAAAQPPRAAGHRLGLLRRRRGRGGPARRGRPRLLPVAGAPARRVDVRPRLRHPARPGRARARVVPRLQGLLRDGGRAVTERLTLAKAINLGLRRAMERDPKVMVMGEDVGPLGGVFRVTDALQKDFGEDRVVDTPLAESGIVGTAIGLAFAGYRPVCEIQFDGFIFPGFDQITTQLAKLRYRSGGRVQVPVVVRVPYGGGIGSIEHHSESPEALFAHTPGLRVVSPATRADACTMIQHAIASPDPVLFFEPKARYWGRGEVDVEAPVDLGESGVTTGLHAARVVRPGRDATLV